MVDVVSNDGSVVLRGMDADTGEPFVYDGISEASEGTGNQSSRSVSSAEAVAGDTAIAGVTLTVNGVEYKIAAGELADLLYTLMAGGHFQAAARLIVEHAGYTFTPSEDDKITDVAATPTDDGDFGLTFSFVDFTPTSRIPDRDESDFEVTLDFGFPVGSDVGFPDPVTDPSTFGAEVTGLTIVIDGAAYEVTDLATLQLVHSHLSIGDYASAAAVIEAHLGLAVPDNLSMSINNASGAAKGDGDFTLGFDIETTTDGTNSSFGKPITSTSTYALALDFHYSVPMTVSLTSGDVTLNLNGATFTSEELKLLEDFDWAGANSATSVAYLTGVKEALGQDLYDKLNSVTLIGPDGSETKLFITLFSDHTSSNSEGDYRPFISDMQAVIAGLSDPALSYTALVDGTAGTSTREVSAETEAEAADAVVYIILTDINDRLGSTPSSIDGVDLTDSGIDLPYIRDLPDGTSSFVAGVDLTHDDNGAYTLMVFIDTDGVTTTETYTFSLDRHIDNAADGVTSGRNLAEVTEDGRNERVLTYSASLLGETGGVAPPIDGTFGDYIAFVFGFQGYDFLTGTEAWDTFVNVNGLSGGTLPDDLSALDFSMFDTYFSSGETPDFTTFVAEGLVLKSTFDALIGDGTQPFDFNLETFDVAYDTAVDEHSGRKLPANFDPLPNFTAPTVDQSRITGGGNYDPRPNGRVFGTLGRSAGQATQTLAFIWEGVQAVDTVADLEGVKVHDPSTVVDKPHTAAPTYQDAHKASAIVVHIRGQIARGGDVEGAAQFLLGLEEAGTSPQTLGRVLESLPPEMRTELLAEVRSIVASESETSTNYFDILADGRAYSYVEDQAFSEGFDTMGALAGFLAVLDSPTTKHLPQGLTDRLTSLDPETAGTILSLWVKDVLAGDGGLYSIADVQKVLQALRPQNPEFFAEVFVAFNKIAPNRIVEMIEYLRTAGANANLAGQILSALPVEARVEAFQSLTNIPDNAELSTILANGSEPIFNALSGEARLETLNYMTGSDLAESNRTAFLALTTPEERATFLENLSTGSYSDEALTFARATLLEALPSQEAAETLASFAEQSGAEAALTLLKALPTGFAEGVTEHIASNVGDVDDYLEALREGHAYSSLQDFAFGEAEGRTSAYEGLQLLDDYDAITTLAYLSEEAAFAIINQWAADDPAGLAVALTQLPDYVIDNLVSLIRPENAAAVLYAVGDGEIAGRYFFHTGSFSGPVRDDLRQLVTDDPDADAGRAFWSDLLVFELDALADGQAILDGTPPGGASDVDTPPNDRALPGNELPAIVVQALADPDTVRNDPILVGVLLAALNDPTATALDNLTVEQLATLRSVLGPAFLNERTAPPSAKIINNSKAIERLGIMPGATTLDPSSYLTPEMLAFVEEYLDSFDAALAASGILESFVDPTGDTPVSAAVAKPHVEKLLEAFITQWNSTHELQLPNAEVVLRAMGRRNLASMGPRTLLLNTDQDYVPVELLTTLSHEMFHFVQFAARDRARAAGNLEGQEFVGTPDDFVFSNLFSIIDLNVNRDNAEPNYRIRHHELQAFYVQERFSKRYLAASGDTSELMLYAVYRLGHPNLWDTIVGVPSFAVRNPEHRPPAATLVEFVNARLPADKKHDPNDVDLLKFIEHFLSLLKRVIRGSNPPEATDALLAVIRGLSLEDLDHLIALLDKTTTTEPGAIVARIYGDRNPEALPSIVPVGPTAVISEKSAQFDLVGLLQGMLEDPGVPDDFKQLIQDLDKGSIESIVDFLNAHKDNPNVALHLQKWAIVGNNTTVLEFIVVNADLFGLTPEQVGFLNEVLDDLGKPPAVNNGTDVPPEITLQFALGNFDRLVLALITDPSIPTSLANFAQSMIVKGGASAIKGILRILKVYLNENVVDFLNNWYENPQNKAVLDWALENAGDLGIPPDEVELLQHLVDGTLAELLPGGGLPVPSPSPVAPPVFDPEDLTVDPEAGEPVAQWLYEFLQNLHDAFPINPLVPLPPLPNFENAGPVPVGEVLNALVNQALDDSGFNAAFVALLDGLTEEEFQELRDAAENPENGEPATQQTLDFLDNPTVATSVTPAVPDTWSSFTPLLLIFSWFVSQKNNNVP